MALVLGDRIKETTSVASTGPATLSGAAIGFQSFAVIGNGNTTYYCIADQGGSNWEVGIGTYSTTGPTLSRTTVLASSNSGSLVNFSAGVKDVFCTYPAEKSVNLDASGNVSLGGTLSVTGHTTFEGVTSTGATGTGALVYSNTPTLVTPNIGAATGASLTATGAITAAELLASNGLVLNNSTVSSSYTIPTGYNATATGPMTVASGAVVTIPSGSRWMIL